jgi:hypothetical protein
LQKEFEAKTNFAVVFVLLRISVGGGQNTTKHIFAFCVFIPPD